MEATLPADYRLDDYRIVAVLGQGGFGITYKARDERLERDVAVKEYLPRQFAHREADSVVRPRTSSDAETFAWGLGRFIDEARALAKFNHPNIVSVIRYLEANGTAYLVMEYEEGRDLEKWSAARSEPPPEDVLVQRILLPLLDGLEKIHAAGLLHRDIKPDNVFIRRDGSPVLIDFGASRAQTGASNLTSIVSAGYSPFEQYGAGEGQGPWSDLYALAGTIYRVVVGRPPTDAISRFQGVAHVAASEAAAGRYSAAFLAAIDRALSTEPRERPQSAAEFRTLLRAANGGPAGQSSATYVRASSETAVRAAPRPGIRPAVLLAGALGVTALLGIGAYFAFVDTKSAPAPETASEVATPATETAPPPAVATEVAVPEVVEAPPPAAPSEDGILDGLTLSDAVRTYRASQIGGALLAYVSNRQKFDECLATQCADLAQHMTKVQEALDGYAWREANVEGRVRIANPRRLSRDDCVFLVDLVEEIAVDGARREQTRAYCTNNGFDRVLQSAGAVNTR
jgi:tRNA A-37 threonylcarbamoyl transferase component Bud32